MKIVIILLQFVKQYKTFLPERYYFFNEDLIKEIKIFIINLKLMKKIF